MAADLAALADRLDRAQFTVAFRGFEPTEVQDLLRSVGAALRSLDAGVVSAHSGPGGAVRGPEGMSVVMRLRRAEKQGAELVRAAQDEAAAVVAAARQEADALKDEAATIREQALARMLRSVREANELVARARREGSDPAPGSG